MLAAALYRRAGKDRNSQELRQGLRETTFNKKLPDKSAKKACLYSRKPQNREPEGL
jgi:hypothetical protein